VAERYRTGGAGFPAPQDTPVARSGLKHASTCARLRGCGGVCTLNLGCRKNLFPNGTLGACWSYNSCITRFHPNKPE
jgi:hypothetical protein